jgi:hypothetical protein
VIDAKHIRNIQILAIKAVEQPTFDDWYRKVCRWYSVKFSTALPDVSSIPANDVLQAYYEELFDAMYSSVDEEVKQRYAEVRKVILEPAAAQDEEQSDEDWEKEMLEEIAEENKKIGVVLPAQDPNLSKVPDQLSLVGDQDFYEPED